MDSHMTLQVQFHQRQEAIAELHKWYECPVCVTFAQPYRLKETESKRTWTLSCGHQFDNLMFPRRVYRVEQGGHPLETFLSFESDTEKMHQWGRSFLVNYYKILYYGNAGTYNVTFAPPATDITDTGNTARTFESLGGGVALKGYNSTQDVAADNTYGMQVGTGSTANVAGTIQLGTLIANGVAATQLSYGSMGITSVTGSAPLSYTLTRTFTNNSGATITINEAGLAYGAADSGGSARFFLVIRDLTGGVAVLNGANTTGTYTLSYTIS